MSATDAFFEQLSRIGQDPRFRKVQGSVRFDIRDHDQVRQWLLTIDHGQIRVSPGGGAATSVLTLSSEVAEAMVRGEMNGLSAMLRGEILVDGDLGLALRMGRLFHTPAIARGTRQPSGAEVTE
ncbi:SCP-2 sterol transfer family protein [Micromonospora citrea]|uniref:SCP-2 sterol transfer family protein n=1 Tax=Micromonospora citrea TaxID=47855 RepID=A0A1C6TRB7_9ACTN|nr:SCP2 sterol-binding domain-containing protein [Micromonospora citrea]SCL44297.1 SCP-2 sterol transfer family protein [Micromonospora citrea]